MLCAIFFGQSAVISSSQSISLASRPRSSIKRSRLLAVDVQHIELADQITEYDCGVAARRRGIARPGTAPLFNSGRKGQDANRGGLMGAVGRIFLLFIGLLLLASRPAAAAPPATCAQKFVGSWTVRVNATGQTYPLIVRPNGTSHITCPLCPSEGTGPVTATRSFLLKLRRRQRSRRTGTP